mgnify:CR=1 FL=1
MENPVDHNSRNLSPFPSWHILVDVRFGGADVVKISGYEEKIGRRGQLGDVQHVHMYVGNVYRKVRGKINQHCKAL